MNIWDDPTYDDDVDDDEDLGDIGLRGPFAPSVAPRERSAITSLGD
jgi:hypothetical protein